MRVSRKQVAPASPDAPTRLRIDLPVAVYYRQSGKSAVGNTSTLMQTIDMVERLVNLGWEQESILVIDLDQGISGAAGLEKRTGLCYLWALIEHELIGTIATVHVDRFFRELELIQANQFIDLCCSHGVHILTPSFIYEFDHPLWGVQHRQLFRLEAQHAADYLHSYVRSRLHKGQRRLQQQGQWAGGRIPIGYLVDNRKSLADGKPNPYWRKLTPFAPMSTVVRAYFEIAARLANKVRTTYHYIRQNGPFFPEEESTPIPVGFKHSIWPRSRSSITGGLMLSRQSLRQLLTNPVYAGHWMMRGQISVANNHPAIVPETALLHRSDHHRKQSQRLVKPASDNTAAPATPYSRIASTAEAMNTTNAKLPDKSAYRGVVYGNIGNSVSSSNSGVSAAVNPASSCSRPAEHLRVQAAVTGTHVALVVRWYARRQTYVYRLPKTTREQTLLRPFYALDCRLVDEQVDALMLQRLLEFQRSANEIRQRQMIALTRDSMVIADLEASLIAQFQGYGGLSASAGTHENADPEGPLRPVDDSGGLRSELGTESLESLAVPLDHPLEVNAVRGLTLGLETWLLDPLDQLRRKAEATHSGFKLLESLEESIRSWPDMQPAQRRQLFDMMAERIIIDRPNRSQFQISIKWRDSTLSRGEVINSSDHFWSPADRRRLAQLFNSMASQEAILAAFPTRTWGSLVAQFAIDRRVPTGAARRLRYHARLPYARNTRWSALKQTKNK